MIKQVLDYLNEFKIERPEPFARVLEVGSRLAGLGSGEQVRQLFSDSKEYIGVDMVDGPNVDQVINGHNLVSVFGENSFDLVLCFDTLEHDNAFWKTVEQMKKVLKPNGWLLISAPGPHCPLHNHPSDYWRFMKEGLHELFDGLAEVIVTEGCWDPVHHGEGSDEVFGKGMKPI